MNILNIKIIEFAGLKKRAYDLSAGLNIIEGLNESGKSSLLAFIKYILYGFSRRAAGEELAERERHVSWSGRRAAGSLTFSAKGKLWRVERDGIVQMRGTRDNFVEDPKIIDIETGTILPLGHCPGEYFLGIPAAVFSSTCCVAQLYLSGIDSNMVSKSIENLLFSADESLNASGASDILNEARKRLLYKNERGGRIFDKRTEHTALRNRFTVATTAAKNIIAKEALAYEYKRQAEAARKVLGSLESTWESSEVNQTLNKFAQKRELEKTLAKLRAERKELETDSFPDLFVPNRQYAAKLGSLSRDLTAAEGALMRAEAELLKLESTLPYDETKLNIANLLALSAAGGTDDILLSYNLQKKSIKTAKNAGLALLAFGGVAAAAGVALLSVTSPLWGIAVVAAGAAAAAAGAFSLNYSNRRRRGLDDYLNKLNLDFDPGSDKLAKHIDDCSAETQKKEEYHIALEARRGVLASLHTRIKTLREECRTYLAQAGSDESDENLSSALAEAAELASVFCTAHESLIMKEENTESELKSIAKHLLRFDEQLLCQKAELTKETEQISTEEYRNRRTELMIAIKTAEDKQIDIEKQLVALDVTAENPRRLALQLEQNEKLLSELQFEYDAITLAGAALTEASEQLRSGVTPRLRKTAGEHMSELTGGKYSDLGIGPDMSITVNTGTSTHPLAALSGGTRDTAYISLRIALAKLLCPDETPPLLLDESLAQLDDIRAANLISMLINWCEKEGGQCLIFTCHRREAALAGERATHIII